VRILRGRELQVWLPERENDDERLHLLRGSMQLLSHLQLQDQLGASYRSRVFLLFNLGPRVRKQAMHGVPSEKRRGVNHV
jgi:hypothetical protein